MLKGNTYRHKNTKEVDLLVLDLIQDSEDSLELSVAWLLRDQTGYQLDNVTIKKRDLENWLDVSD